MRPPQTCPQRLSNPAWLQFAATASSRSLPKPYTPEDVRSAAKRLSDRYKLVDEDMEDEFDYCGQVYFDDSRDSAEQSLYCLRIGKATVHRHNTIHVLLFVPTGGAENQYRLVGIGEIVRLDWFDDCEATTFDII